jgi:hypothetical protein
MISIVQQVSNEWTDSINYECKLLQVLLNLLAALVWYLRRRHLSWRHLAPSEANSENQTPNREDPRGMTSQSAERSGEENPATSFVDLSGDGHEFDVSEVRKDQTLKISESLCKQAMASSSAQLSRNKSPPIEEGNWEFRKCYSNIQRLIQRFDFDPAADPTLSSGPDDVR